MGPAAKIQSAILAVSLGRLAISMEMLPACMEVLRY